MLGMKMLRAWPSTTAWAEMPRAKSKKTMVRGAGLAAVCSVADDRGATVSKLLVPVIVTPFLSALPSAGAIVPIRTLKRRPTRLP